jgi:disulfide bond formation protein DsbB
MSRTTIAFCLGAAALAIILGALGFQYIGGIPPCEMCHWQRWPHIAAAAVGLGGSFLLRMGLVERRADRVIAWLAAILIAASGVIGAYHAGVEWHWWPGPQACTGPAFHYAGGALDLNAPVVMCDVAAWRLFGLSLAGYNALLSFAIAGCGMFLLTQRKKTA